MTRRSCDLCHGTDTQRECEQGQCYAEESLRRQHEREDEARAIEAWADAEMGDERELQYDHDEWGRPL